MQTILVILVVASCCMSFGEAQVPKVCSSIEILVNKTCYHRSRRYVEAILGN